LFYRVTPQGLHMRAVLNESAFFRETGMFPAADMLHIRGFSVNGLLGASRITLAREAIALGLGTGTAGRALDGQCRQTEWHAHH
jgi:hypothetical protein